MTTTPQTTSTAAVSHESIAEKQGAFSDSCGEPEYGAVRRQLGLRPNAFRENGPDNHPDRRPCPPWCWVGQSHGEYDHEVDQRHPMTALHAAADIPHVVASLFEGSGSRGSSDRWVQAATIEPHLEQLGQEAPIIRVHLRKYEGRDMQFNEILKLSLTDAHELATALNHLIETVVKS